MFRRRFLIIEIRDNGMKIAHYIKGKFMNSIISKILSNKLSKKLGCDVNIHFDGINVELIDDEININCSNLCLKVNKEDATKLIK